MKKKYIYTYTYVLTHIYIYTYAISSNLQQLIFHRQDLWTRFREWCRGTFRSAPWKNPDFSDEKNR